VLSSFGWISLPTGLPTVPWCCWWQQGYPAITSLCYCSYALLIPKIDRDLGDLSLFRAYFSWASPCPQSNASVLERLPFSTRRKDRCSVVSDLIHWLWATCGWVFLEVGSSLMEDCESQQQLHVDGLQQEHCVQCGQRISSVVSLPCWKVGTPWHSPDFRVCYMTSWGLGLE